MPDPDGNRVRYIIREHLRVITVTAPRQTGQYHPCHFILSMIWLFHANGRCLTDGINEPARELSIPVNSVFHRAPALPMTTKNE